MNDEETVGSVRVVFYRSPRMGITKAWWCCRKTMVYNAYNQI